MGWLEKLNGARLGRLEYLDGARDGLVTVIRWS